MRKYYYYSNGKDRKGPVSVDELFMLPEVNSETLIWYQGLSEWVRFDHVKSELPGVNACRAVGATSDRVPRKMFAHPFSFKGRIGRLEYAISFITSFPVAYYAALLIGEDEAGFFSWFAYVIGLWINIAQGAKRCHDIGLNGYWQCVWFPATAFLHEVAGLYPHFLPKTWIVSKSWYLLGGVILTFILMLKRGDIGENEYCPDPRGK
jgi:uncharacterized membrane protein YhaH (DUF805 family)